MKKAPNNSALNGFRKPHRKSLPGPVSETAREMTDAAIKNLAIIFIDTVFAAIQHLRSSSPADSTEFVLNLPLFVINENGGMDLMRSSNRGKENPSPMVGEKEL